MTRFHDGPADGQALMIRRAPLLLRVVQALNKFDALDAISDVTDPKARIFVYHRFGDIGKRGYFVVATYRLFHLQPPDSTLRDNSAWQDWCLETAKTTPL